ncbi:NHLP leader peptide family RiPP precursor [Desulfovibrio inopinatus]|uniref:NHLP leader peptide family RiPP precursor n=1 Tax=Desulfovibrio inopinatus TaxID=102109 RepID=UPI0004205DBD|nr:NHLP leader peptide family RiPP precursor [Desulfovibrio inopinatus]
MSEMNEQQKQWARIVAKSWADEEFKQRLLSDPTTVLAEEGVSFPAGAKVSVLEAKENEAVLVLPTKPTDAELGDVTEERLAAMVDAFGIL